ncbi:hypothetical protein [Streptomyces sp. NPDC056144]|uniref:hypothetical protein n=1 Tax=unclassified Streptomyces TaxID=2593676 RepID=UPI0035E19D6D
MVSGRRTGECEACGAPYGRWVGSLRMALCGSCEQAEAECAAREPVLIGEVLQGMAEAVALATASGPPGGGAGGGISPAA